MKDVALPNTPRELYARLVQIFPRFEKEWRDHEYEEEWEDRERTGLATFHFVLHGFTPYFGANHSTFSESQLKQFASLINQAVERDDDLENAVATCFLEALHQDYNVLKPHLSKLAKRKTRP